MVVCVPPSQMLVLTLFFFSVCRSCPSAEPLLFHDTFSLSLLPSRFLPFAMALTALQSFLPPDASFHQTFAKVVFRTNMPLPRARIRVSQPHFHHKILFLSPAETLFPRQRPSASPPLKTRFHCPIFVFLLPQSRFFNRGFFATRPPSRLFPLLITTVPLLFARLWLTPCEFSRHGTFPGLMVLPPRFPPLWFPSIYSRTFFVLARREPARVSYPTANFP